MDILKDKKVKDSHLSIQVHTCKCTYKNTKLFKFNTNKCIDDDDNEVDNDDDN